MDIKIQLLYTYFHESNPEEILSSINNTLTPQNYTKNHADELRFLLNQNMPYYSMDEIQNISNLNKDKDKFEELQDFANKVLIMSGKHVRVRYDKMLAWSVISNKLDADLFVSSFLAELDSKTRNLRKDFNWDIVLKSNNTVLQQMLNQGGMAENHFHLNGSSPHYYFSWISLMNQITKRKKAFEDTKMANNRLSPDKKTLSIVHIVYKASCIRLLLADWVLADIKESILDKDEKKKFWKFLYSSEEYITAHLHEIQNKIESLQQSLSEKATDRYEQKHQLDYLRLKGLDYENKASEYLVGERWLTYHCFRKLNKSREENSDYIEYSKLFQAYIIIKNKFRSEILQSNNKVGFHNFSEYQDRKEAFIEGHPILEDAVKSIAILSSIKNQNISLLEARISPGKNQVENRNKIKVNDKLISKKIEEDGKNKWFSHLDNKEEFGISDLEGKLFYVLHFPKMPDDSLERENSSIGNLNFYERHHNYRVELKKKCFAIAKLRDSYAREGNRIYGIDACSSEIGCRPEVFAQVFRYLKRHIVDDQYNMIRKFLKNDRPQLKITYHVGEDFLDVVDGMRAIDEAILFLNMDYGDRIGHGLALGVNPREWYVSKHGEIVLPQMDILDNIAWLILKLQELHIENSYMYLEYLQNMFWEYYYKVYDNLINCDDRIMTVTIEAYIQSWKLRGDNPELLLERLKAFREGKTVNQAERKGITYWERTKVNDLVPNYVRDNVVATKLAYLYHYNKKVKEEGFKVAILK